MNIRFGKTLFAVVCVVAVAAISPVAFAQKAALVRDVDRPSASPVSASCSDSNDCLAFTVPAGKIFVLEAVSFFITVPAENQGLVRLIVYPSGGGPTMLLPHPQLIPSSGVLLAQNVVLVRGYYTANTPVRVQLATGSGILASHFTQLIGHLVDQ
jgi:hypothetical protein